MIDSENAAKLKIAILSKNLLDTPVWKFKKRWKIIREIRTLSVKFNIDF